ncbi:MAG: YicC family protein [Lachnospiraceae bacterium]|nr:YicC family protein [Lachnospiraceae bacterium]
MICSMTGFGAGEASDDRYRITTEIKTVNNRYLDINVRLPRTFNAFDPVVRALVKEHLCRGKTDVYISFETIGESEAKVTCNRTMAAAYVQSMRALAGELDLTDDLSVTGIARLPDVFTIEEEKPDEETLRALVAASCRDALTKLNEARAKEGAFLVKDIEGKLTRIRDNVDFIRERVPRITAQYEEKLKERIRSLLEDTKVDEARLLTEVAIFADKTSVDEELVRLTAHIDSFFDVLGGGDTAEGVGRKLDFIVQEMNREANTTLSKSPDMEVSERAVEIKTEIEKIREQIQNLE